MDEKNYKIGDKVWVARFDPMSPEYVECPDCGGSGRIRVIFHDESIVSIECGGCSAGYEPPTGRIKVYCQSVRTEYAPIERITHERDGVEYLVRGCYVHNSGNVFDSEDDARNYGEMEAQKHKTQQLDKISRKEKDTKSWAWNASYHRKRIKDAQKDINYHTAKLNVASLKSKEPA